MGRLKSALQSKYSEREENIKVYTPKNCETLKLHFRGEKMAKVIATIHTLHVVIQNALHFNKLGATLACFSLCNLSCIARLSVPSLRVTRPRTSRSLVF